MTRTQKWLFAAMCLFLVGAVVFVCGMSALKWNFYKMDATKYTQKEFLLSPEQSLEKVELNVDSFPVRIVAGEEIKLSYYEASDANVSVSFADGVLNVKEDYKYNPFKNGLFNLGRGKHKYVLSVPQGMPIVFGGKSLDLSMTGLQNVAVSLDGGNADLSFTDCTFSDFTVKSKNADITLRRCRGENAAIRATNLDIEVEHCDFTSMQIQSTNADVEIDYGTYGALSVSGTNGDYDIKDLAVHTLSVHATNLDASIRIAGNKEDYTIQSSGKNLPREQTGTTDKSITLSGTNNDVSLRFV